MSEVRKVETGVDHKGDPTFEYQFGAEVDGYFVPFVTKSAGYVEQLAQRERDAQQQQSAASASASTEQREQTEQTGQ